MARYIICLLLLGSVSVTAQRLQTPTLSPFTRITQEVGLTEITLEYSRPSAKGRVIFGDLVPYDQMWRTGANASTKITLTESASIAGSPIEAGTYALYTIPGAQTWTMIIHSNTRMRSIAGDTYKPELDLFRFQATPRKTDDFVETFTIQFGNVRTSGCDLILSWENTVVSFPIEVEVDAKIAAQMAEMLKDPESIPHRTFFEAAQYYLHNDKDLDTALEWIDAALDNSTRNFRYGLLKARIQFKAGDLEAAMQSINAAHGWAVEAHNANYIEQTALFRKQLQSGTD